ncbi:MAG: carotenoid oxygenase family protein, partial [Pseudomonadota bacterium]
LYQLAPSGKMTKRSAISIDRLAFCHDNAMTDRYLVFMVMPVNFTNPIKVLLARDTIDKNMVFQPEHGMKVYVVSLNDFGLVRTFDVEPFMFAHASNCWERGDELFIDVVAMSERDGEEGTLFSRNIFSQPRPATGTLTRFRLNMKTGACHKEALPSALPCEFPQWDWRHTGSETRFTYTAGICENETPGFYNAIQKVDYLSGESTVYDCGPGRYTSEPIFVARNSQAEEGDGYLLFVVYDAATERSELMILDAHGMADEIAAVPLRNHIPHGFHCSYVSL